MSTDLTDKTILITGANTGIGKETALSLAGMGATLILACRTPEKAEAARADIAAQTGNQKISTLHIDLADLATVRAAAAEFLKTHDRLDVLINNAGIMRARRESTADGFEALIGVNFLGPFLFTNLLLELLKRSAPSRIVTVSSSMESSGHLDFTDLMLEHTKYDGMAAYGRSKLALILFTKELARRLAGSSVTANALHPGIAFTQLGEQLNPVQRLFVKSIAKSAKEISATSVYLASAPEVAGVSGEYFIDCQPAKPSSAALDEVTAKRLWEVAETLVGLKGQPERLTA